MELDQLYESAARLKSLGVIVDTYSGSGGLEDEVDEPDSMVLSDLMEYICVRYPQDRPAWLEALYQVMAWQFETFHEWAGGYYDNSYGDSPYELQVKTADFLHENRYSGIETPYRRGMTPCGKGCYPKELSPLAQEIRAWMWDNTEAVWLFCLDLLERHRGDWPEPRGREPDV